MINLIPVKTLGLPELDMYARLSETRLAHLYEPQRGVFIAESPKVIERALSAGCEAISALMAEEDTGHEASKLLPKLPDIPVYTAPSKLLTELTGFQLTRGMLCAMYRPVLPSAETLCRNARRIAVLERIMNPTNIGAIFRSAAALNMDAVLLSPDCSDPLYRRAIRVSMGTVFQIPWTFFDRQTAWPDAGMEMLRRLGFKTAAMALKEDSVSVDDPRLSAEEKLAVILGSEGDGLCGDTISACDYTVCIPMSHGVDSLNVAAASAVAFWALGRS